MIALTRRFTDRWARYAPLVPVAAALLALGAIPLRRTLLDEHATITDDEPYTSRPLSLEPRLVGAYRVEAIARLAESNSWAALDLGVLDASGQPIANVVKEVWREHGTWSEGGESGTWAEADSDALWETRAATAEAVTLQIGVIDQGHTDGRVEADFPVELRVRVTSGVVDHRYLVTGVVVSALLALLAWYAGGHGGRPVVVEKMDDHQVIGRAECGGAGRLVTVSLFCLSDETTPPEVRVRLTVRDAQGELLFEDDGMVAARYRKDEGEIEDARVERRWHLELLERQSHGFTVTVEPDGPVEWTKLLVRDGATTRGAVPVETIGQAVRS